MEDYNKIIEALSIKYKHVKSVAVSQPIIISDFYATENTMIFVQSGQLSFENSSGIVEVKEGGVVFLPERKKYKLHYGTNASITLTAEELMLKRDLYLQPQKQDFPSTLSFIDVAFEVNVFNSIKFFFSLEIEPFSIMNKKISNIIKYLEKENNAEEVGSARVLKLKTEQLVIEVVRYLIENKLFVKQMATKTTYFKDERLVSIFKYVKENIHGDLSNKMIAKEANISEDYIGQYFKLLTGINPQDYIEHQRMEKAVHLLRFSRNSIRGIAKQVGYKDTAYFCRRFKIMYGIPAGKMRKRESLVNI